jgi:hypothetical protein
LLTLCIAVFLVSTPIFIVEAASSSSTSFVEKVIIADNTVVEDEAEVLEVYYRVLPNGITQYRIWSVTYGVWRTEWTNLP